MASLRLYGPTAINSDLLEIKPSTIENAKLGLFTLRDRSAGSFVGVYGGVFAPERKASGAYCADFPGGVGEEGVILPQTKEGTDEIDYERYPLAAINEPPPGKTANVFVVEDVVYDFEGRSFRLLALHTASNVAKDEELFWHYGGNYSRDYEVGTPAVPIVPSPKINEKTLKELVETRLGTAVFEVSERNGARIGASQEASDDESDDDDSKVFVKVPPAEPWPKRLRVRAA
jgi:hypothetical protein